MLIDLNKCVAPKLYVMDGIVAMEGNGPGSGDPVPMNVLLMSTDPVALDSVFSRLVYLKPEMVPTMSSWPLQAVLSIVSSQSNGDRVFPVSSMQMGSFPAHIPVC